MASILTGTFDPSQVIVTVDNILLSEFDEGDAIMAELNEDSATIVTGLGGASGVAINPSNAGTFTFKLLQTSRMNGLLSDLVKSDSLTKSNLRVVPISITDGSGNDKANATQCIIKSVPKLGFSKGGLSERLWVFHAFDMRIYAGGNN